MQVYILPEKDGCGTHQHILCRLGVRYLHMSCRGLWGYRVVHLVANKASRCMPHTHTPQVCHDLAPFPSAGGLVQVLLQEATNMILYQQGDVVCHTEEVLNVPQVAAVPGLQVRGRRWIRRWWLADVGIVCQPGGHVAHLDSMRSSVRLGLQQPCQQHDERRRVLPCSIVHGLLWGLARDVVH